MSKTFTPIVISPLLDYQRRIQLETGEEVQMEVRIPDALFDQVVAELRDALAGPFKPEEDAESFAVNGQMIIVRRWNKRSKCEHHTGYECAAPAAPSSAPTRARSL